MARGQRRCASPFSPQLIALGILITPLLATLVAGMAIVKVCDKTHRAIVRAHKHHRAALRHLPKSDPLLNEHSFSSEDGWKETEKKPVLGPLRRHRSGTPLRATRNRPGACFLDLPIELRRCIYNLAVEQQRFVQPTTGRAYWGYQFPGDCWPLHKRIRSDIDPPSMSLQLIIGLGGFWLNQNPSPRVKGCVRHGPVQMLFVHESVVRRRDSWGVPPSGTSRRVEHTDLMQTCREVYADMLDVLYGDVTVCLLGAEMIRYFLRNVSPEGLPAVRFVQTALLIDAAKWDTRRSKKTLESAVRGLANKLTGLKQLHVEVVLMFGQPTGSSKGDAGNKFWAWLRDVFETSGLGRLDNFVLKISVYTPGTGVVPTADDVDAVELPVHYGRWMHQVVPFAAWREDEYQALKTKLTTDCATYTGP